MTNLNPSLQMPKHHVEKHDLPNGTTVLYSPNPDNQIVAIKILSRFASRHEIRGKAGMANLTMRLLSSGTTQHNEEEIADLLERNGAIFKASAGTDWSGVELLTTSHFLRDDLATVMELLDSPTFEEKKLQRERDVVRMNILEQEDSRLTLTMKIFRQHYYGTHPYSWPSIGLTDSLNAIEKKDSVAFAHCAFDPSQLVVSVVGGSSDSGISSAILDAFAARGKRKGISTPESILAKSAITEDTDIIEQRESESDYVVMGYPGCGLICDDNIPLRLTSAILGGSMDSRLFREIRDKRGLCYQVGSSFAPNMDHTPFLIYVVTTPPNRNEAIACAENEVERLKTETIENDELQRVKNYLSGLVIMSQETNMGQSGRYGMYEITGLGYDYADCILGEINSVTVEDIQRCAQTYFTHRLLTVTTQQEK